MIIIQQVIAADTKYPIQVPPGLVTFDVHNDSPFNMAINFDTDSGLGSAEYYMSPHSILYGLSSANSAPGFSVGGSRGAGQIFVYTQSPLGGVIATSSAPAYSLTIMGYPVGRAPQSTVSLNRLANLGNSVPLSSSATSIVNDGSAVGTSVVEATEGGSSGSNVSLLNDGTLVLSSFISGVLSQIFKSVPSAVPAASVLLLGDSNRQVEVLGALKVDGTSFIGPTQIFGALTAKSTASLDNGAITTNGAGIMSLVALQSTSKVVVNGTTSGTVTAYQFMQGELKCMFVYWNNYRNSTTTEQRLTFPAPFTTYAGWIAFGGIPQTKVFLSNSQLISKVFTVSAFPAGIDGAGNRLNSTLINGYSYGSIASGFDQLGLGTSQAGTTSDGALFIGL